MSRFTEKMYRNARTVTTGMVTGEPHEPVRHTWGEVHERARRIAGGLAAAGVGPGDAVGVLAGFPVEIAPTAQGLWMRGASLTMLHQPTPRTDLAVWAEDTMNVIGMIEAKAVIVSEPFLVAIPVLEEKGITVLTVAELLAAEPIDPVETGEDDLALMQLTSGSTGSPKAVQITHRNIHSNAEAMFIGAEYDVEKDVMVSWLPCFHDMGMVGFLTIPMYFGAELVKVTPMDFLRDTLLWAKLIDKYKGTMTAAPNFAYALFAKRLRKQAKPGEFDLSTLRFALSGAEPVEPADVEDLIDAGKPFGLQPEAILPAYGMAETTLAVSFSECGAGLVVDEVDADLLAALRRAVPATKGNTKRLATLGPLLEGLEARIIDEHGNVMPARGVGVIELRGESLTPGYITMGGFVPAQDEHGWYDTGDLGYLIDNGHVVVCGRVKDVIIMAGPQHLPDRHRAGRRPRRGRAAGLCRRRPARRRPFARDLRRRGGVQRLAGPARGAPHRAPGRPRGGDRGRRAAAQRRGARARHHPEDAVGQAAPGQLGLAGHLTPLRAACRRVTRVSAGITDTVVDMTPAIEAIDLVKRFGDPAVVPPAVDRVSFAVPPGTVLGLLGPNGAGKTTTVRMMTTLTEPTSGTARVAGYDVLRATRRGAPQHGAHRSGRHGRRTAHRPREHPDDRRPLRHPAQGAHPAGRSTAGAVLRSPTPPTRWSSPTPAGCVAASTSRSACSRRRRCSSSTSRPPASTRAAAAICGTCCAASSSRAPRCCSPPSTWRRPTSSRTTSSSSTGAASSPRDRRWSSSARPAMPAWWSP